MFTIDFGGGFRFYDIIMVMDISWVYVWSQVLTVIEYALLGASYLAKNRKSSGCA